MINVLSLFDGLSGARIALEQLGIKCVYYASEIDKYAIEVSKKNYPDIIHLGDIRGIKTSKLPKIDLLIGGSPCQDLTMAGTKKGLEGERSSLFYEYIRIKNELKPKWFLLENVSSMKHVDRDKMSELMGVQPIKINSADFSVQNRKRYYWTNIEIPAWDKNTSVLKDILEDIRKGNPIINSLTKTHHAAFFRSYNWKSTDINGKSKVLMASYYKKPPYSPYVPCKWSESGYRMLTAIECERLQGIPDGYTDTQSNSQRYKMLGNGFTVPVIKHILSPIKKEIQEKVKPLKKSCV